MTRDDIIRMAKEAHKDLVTVDYPGHAGQLDPWTLRLLERFAALFAAAEREACAAIAEKELGNTAMLTSMPPKSSAAWNILFAVRARGET